MVFVLLLVSILLSGCTAIQVESEATLSELQITACNSADEGGTCDSRLEDLGIVTKAECCINLGKCCT